MQGDAGERSRKERGLLRYQVHASLEERLITIAAIQEIISVSKIKARPPKDSEGRPIRGDVAPVLCFNAKPELIPLLQEHLNLKLGRDVLIEERRDTELSHGG